MDKFIEDVNKFIEGIVADTRKFILDDQHIWVPALAIIVFVVQLYTHGIVHAIAAVIGTLLLSALVIFVLTDPSALFMLIILALLILTSSPGMSK